MLNDLNALRRLTGGDCEQDGFETRAGECDLGFFCKVRRDARVGNDRATFAEAEGGALLTQTAQEAGADLDLIAAAAEGYRNDAHAFRISVGQQVSKICRSA